MRLLLALLALLSANPLTGQRAAAPVDATTREPGFGIVRALDGSPWSGAEVHLLHRPHADLFDESVADRLTATTDERGRFRVDLLPGARYVVWARSPTDRAQGTVRVTSRSVDACARTPILLQEVEPVPRRGLRLEIDPSWHDAPRLRVLASSRSKPGEATERRWLHPDHEGHYHLPIWWDATLRIDVFSGGWLVRRLWLPPRREPTTDEPEDAGTETWTRTLPQRWTRTVRLVEPDGSTPVVGATARLLGGPTDLDGPRSDNKGHFEVVACDDPELGKREMGTYVVEADGFAERTFVTLHCSKDVVPTITRRCTPGFRLLGAVLLDGQPLPAVSIAVQAEVEQEIFNRWDVLPDRVVHTDAEGRFQVSGLSARAGYRLVAVLNPSQTASLAASLAKRRQQAGKPPFQAPLAPLVILDSLPIESGAENVPRAAFLDLAQLECFELEFQTADREPAATLPVFVAGHAEGNAARMAVRTRQRIGVPTRLCTDRNGRIGLLANDPENLVTVLGIPGQGLGWARLPATGSRITIPVQRQHSLRIEAVDVQGRTAEGAQAHCLFQPSFDGRGIVTPDDEAALIVAGLLRHTWFGYGWTPLDRDGRAGLLLPAGLPGQAIVDVVASGSRRGRRMIELRADTDRTERWQVVVD